MNSAIIVAGGKGSRMNSSLPKQFLQLNDYPILYYTLEKFFRNDYVDEIIIVIHEDYLDSEHLLNSIPPFADRGKYKIVSGGSTRQESVYKGFQNLASKSEIVLVHDGVRPFVSPDIISKNIRKCQEQNAILTAYPATNTLKTVQDGIVQSTLDRDKIWQAQTPQTFEKELLQKGLERARAQNITGTDEASIVEKISNVHILKGNKDNIKITHQEDLLIAKAILKG